MNRILRNSISGAVAAAALLWAGASPARAADGACVSIAASSAQKGGGAYGTTFSATAIIDIDLSVLFTQASGPTLSGDHVAEFKIYTPDHGLYQSISVPFTSNVQAQGTKREIPGYPMPLPVKVLSPTTIGNARYLRATARLPVGGTLIVSNGLYGAWTVQAFIDGSPVACSTPVAFTITP
jgi:hypothetical protein